MTRDEKIAKIKALRKSGKTYDEIAKTMKLSPQRVGFYVRTIEGKSTRKKTTAKKTVKKTSKSAPKKQTRGAREAAKAAEAFGKAHGLSKKTDVRPQPKSVSARKPKTISEKIPAPSLAESAAAIQG